MPKDFSYMYPAYPIVGSMSVFLCMISIPAHVKVGNIAIVSFGLWLSIGLLMLVIGSCVWHGNVRNPYPIWGDIVQQYFVMMPVGLATCMLCIQYRLWCIARTATVFITKSERKRRIYTTWFFCVGIPLVVGVIHYVSQGHRYNLWEDLGPFLETYNTAVGIATYSIWEPLFIFIAGIYGIHTVALFLARRKELDVALSSGSININKNRYLRLMGIAIISLALHFPISLWIFISNCVVIPVEPWISWKDTHSHYGRISYLTRFMASLIPNIVILTYINWWALVLSGFTFFIFFGLGEEATKQYRFWLRMCLRPFGIEYPKEEPRNTVERTWLDILLRRLGRPVLPTSGPQHVIGHFNVDPAETRPSDYTNGASQSRSDVASANLDPTRVNPEDLPGQSNVTNMANEAVHIGEHQVSDAQTDIPDIGFSNVPEEEQDGQVPSPSTEFKAEADLEAQRGLGISVGEQRRREILEKDPELTEEVFF